MHLVNKGKNKKKKQDKKDGYSEINSIQAGLTNEVMYVITFTILNVIIFNRAFQFTIFEYQNKKIKEFCAISFDNIVTFIPQNLCILFAINFFYFFYLIVKMKDDRKIKFFWKSENYNFLIRIYSLVLIQAYADHNFQFYLYLNLMDKD